jgi:hypothetical protein
MNIAHNQAWKGAEEALSQGVMGFTAKLTIGAHDLYVILGSAEGRPVIINITLGRSAECDMRFDNPTANELATQAANDTRAMIEVCCQQATALLQADVWSVDDLIAQWRGTKFDPSGACPQVQGVVSSPLDAVARYLQQREAA